MKKSAATPHIVLFVEGDTDKIFFDALLAYYRANSSTPLCSCEVKNLKGVTRYSSKVLGKLKNELMPAAAKKNMVVTAVCCSYDTDVFTDASRPIVDWNRVRKEVKSLGINEFVKIEVEASIEDWILDDLNGICRHLRLNNKPNPSGVSGYERMMSLYSKANRVYVKGVTAAALISSLDIGLIRNKRLAVLTPFESLLGFIM